MKNHCKILPAIALSALLLALPLAGCKNEQQSANENKPLTRQDLEDVLSSPRKLTEEEKKAREAVEAEEKRMIEAATKGYFDDEPTQKSNENQNVTP